MASSFNSLIRVVPTFPQLSVDTFNVVSNGVQELNEIRFRLTRFLSYENSIVFRKMHTQVLLKCDLSSFLSFDSKRFIVQDRGVFCLNSHFFTYSFCAINFAKSPIAESFVITLFLLIILWINDVL